VNRRSISGLCWKQLHKFSTQSKVFQIWRMHEAAITLTWPAHSCFLGEWDWLRSCEQMRTLLSCQTLHDTLYMYAYLYKHDTRLSRLPDQIDIDVCFLSVPCFSVATGCLKREEVDCQVIHMIKAY
jgi:hypothetical protein